MSRKEAKARLGPGGRSLSYGGQPGARRTAGRTGAAQSGLPAGAKDGSPPTEETQAV